MSHNYFFSEPKFAVLADGLAINNVTMKDAGIYICKATERYTGAMKEKNITLRVERKYWMLFFYCFSEFPFNIAG